MATTRFHITKKKSRMNDYNKDTKREYLYSNALFQI